MDKAIAACKEVGLGECELWQGHVEPQGNGARRDARSCEVAPGNAARQLCRTSASSGTMPAFALFAYNLSFNDSFTDEEIDRGFQMAKAMGVKVITASSTLSAAKKVAPFADKHKIEVAMHGHDNMNDPNQFAKPESFEAALEMSQVFHDQSRYRPLRFARATIRWLTCKSITTASWTCTSRIATRRTTNLPFGAGRDSHQGSAPAAQEEQVEHSRQHRIRIQGRRTPWPK